MRAIFIDSVNQQVKEVTVDGRKNTLDQWYEILGVTRVETGLYITEHDSIIVDEEGLLKPCDHFFTYEGAHQPFAGNGLVVGADEEGETVSCDIDEAQVRSKVKFYNKDQIIQKIAYGLL